jgi:hypothetical protein
LLKNISGVDHYWNGIKNGKQYQKQCTQKKNFPSIFDRINAKEFKPNFKTTQFLSSHGNFKSYFVRFNISNDYLCDCEKAIKTPLHMIIECDKNINERQQLIGEVNRLGLK